MRVRHDTRKEIAQARVNSFLRAGEGRYAAFRAATEGAMRDDLKLRITQKDQIIINPEDPDGERAAQVFIEWLTD